MTTGPTIAPVADPYPYFKVAATGTVHLVRTVVRVAWPNGDAHESVNYWCRNIALATSGGYYQNKPYEGPMCRRCEREIGRKRKG